MLIKKENGIFSSRVDNPGCRPGMPMERIEMIGKKAYWLGRIVVVSYVSIESTNVWTRS